MPMASKYRSFWATAVNSLALSLLVETFQLLTRVGCFDVDDLVLNTLGNIRIYHIHDMQYDKEKIQCEKKRKNKAKERKKSQSQIWTGKAETL